MEDLKQTNILKKKGGGELEIPTEMGVSLAEGFIQSTHKMILNPYSREKQTFNLGYNTVDQVL